MNTTDANEFYSWEAGNVATEDIEEEIVVDGHTDLMMNEEGLLVPVCKHNWDEGEVMGFGFKRCTRCGEDFE